MHSGRARKLAEAQWASGPSDGVEVEMETRGACGAGATRPGTGACIGATVIGAALPGGGRTCGAGAGRGRTGGGVGTTALAVPAGTKAGTKAGAAGVGGVEAGSCAADDAGAGALAG